MRKPTTKPATKPKPAPAKPSPPVAARRRVPAWLLAGALALATLAWYWPTTRHDFVNYDDGAYVTANAHVQNGLTWANLKWAFLNPVAQNWHPLTILSHMADCQFYGLQPWGHHLTSIVLHALNAALVFVLLLQLTGAIWRSLFVAALFAFHPLRVESVAWIAERKDVLSGFFGLLALIFYARFVGQLQIKDSKSKIFYCLALFFFALGLMSKPMLVTWPFVLLLLDYWPLGRFQPGCAWRLAREKIPFFALAAAAGLATFLVQQRGGAMLAMEQLPLGDRVGNALVSYCRYLGKLFWPTDLAVFYPHLEPWTTGQVLLAGALVVGVTALVFAQRRRCPFMLIGWLWFIGTLVPVIGLVQVGMQAMADRYTYLPSLGVLVMVVWGTCELTRRSRYGGIALSVTGTAAIVLCLDLTHRQLGYWQDSETLFRHALDVTENNTTANNDLGLALAGKGQIDEAIRHYQQAIQMGPDFAEAYNNLGLALIDKGQTNEAIHEYQEALRLKPSEAFFHDNLGIALFHENQNDDAIREFQEALRLTPDDALAHDNLGIVLAHQGRTGDAISQFQEALLLNPSYPDAHINLGLALIDTGQIDEAIGQYREALRLKPDNAIAHGNLAIALYKRGQTDEAISQYQEALRFKPDYAEAHYNLGVVLDGKGRMDEAVSQYQEAVRLKPDYVVARNNLGIVLAKQGRVDEAIRQFQEALRLKPDFTEARNNLASALGMKRPSAGR